MTAAPNSRKKLGLPSLSSSSKLAMRKKGSPRKVPPIGVAIRGVRERESS
jgi:hypothetical protein